MDSRIRRLQRACATGDLEAERALVLLKTQAEGPSTEISVKDEDQNDVFVAPSGQLKFSDSRLLFVNRTSYQMAWKRNQGYTVTHAPTGLAVLDGIRTQALAVSLMRLVDDARLWAFADKRSPLVKECDAAVWPKILRWKGVHSDWKAPGPSVADLLNLADSRQKTGN